MVLPAAARYVRFSYPSFSLAERKTKDNQEGKYRSAEGQSANSDPVTELD
jgi:hypothetical protein